MALFLLLMRNPRFDAYLTADYWTTLDKLSEVMILVEQYSIQEDANYADMGEVAANAILHRVDDYSGYMPPINYEDFENATNQQYVGIGVQIERVNQRIIITEVFENSPAYRVSLQPGDRIVGVGTTNTESFTLMEIVTLLRGEPGTDVDVTVYRALEDRRITETLTRAVVNYPHIRDVELSSDGIGYLRLTQFGSNTEEEFREATRRLKRQGMRALIIDLRGNPGGILQEAVDMAGHFMLPGSTVVSIRGRQGRILGEERTANAPTLDLPVAILVDRNSASASEILAGALQDSAKAVIIGETTFGKGSVQSIYRLKDGAGLRMTTARYHLPGGRTVQDVGVTPDIVVDVHPFVRSMEWALRSNQGMPDEEFANRFGFTRPVDAVRETANEVLIGVLVSTKPNP